MARKWREVGIGGDGGSGDGERKGRATTDLKEKTAEEEAETSCDVRLSASGTNFAKFPASFY